MKSFFVLTIAGFLLVMGANGIERNEDHSAIRSFQSSSLCAVHYTARKTELRSGNLILENDASVVFKDTIMTAERIYMNKDDKELRAIKNVTLKVNNKIVQEGIDSLTLKWPSCR